MPSTDGAGEYERPTDYNGTTSPHALARAITSTPIANTYDPSPAGHLTRIKAPSER